MSEGMIYWVVVAIASVVAAIFFVVVNSVSESSIFWAGCFVATFGLAACVFTVREFRKM